CRSVTVSRTGYTGEDGFEIFVAPADGEALWTRLLEAGADKGLLPAGVGARDTLRLEARMCLYGQDMDETTTLVEAGLGWIVSTDEAKGDYPGRAVLAEQKRSGPPRKLVGFEVTGRGIARHGYPVLVEGDRGTVGITDYAQKQLGDVVYVELPEKGRTLAEHDSFGTVESVKAVSELFSPVAGEVVEANTALVSAPEAINTDPYGKAWMIKVRLSDPKAVASLMDAAAYGKYVAREAK